MLRERGGVNQHSLREMQMTKSVALVLGSGGARGYAHIGVIEEIERRGYTIECVAGCSMGAVVGGIYAAGELDAYCDWVSGLDYLDVLRLLDFGFGNLGAIRGERIFRRIHEILGEVDIENLRIPFTAVATDLTNQQEVWFQQGCLHQAMRASAAIPSVFAPVRQGNRVLVDGGLLNPLPINPVVSSHCDLIMAVNLNGESNGYTLPVIARPAPIRQQLEGWMEALRLRNPFNGQGQGQEEEEGDRAQKLVYHAEDVSPADVVESRNKDEKKPVQNDLHLGPASMLELVHQSFETMQASLTRYKIAGYPPDVVFEVPKRLCRFFEFQRAPELIELGRMVASDTLDEFEQRRH